MNRQAQAAILFLVGAAVLHASVTDLYLRYVKAGLRPLLLAAGVVLIAAALATLWYEIREHRASAGRGGAGARTGHGPSDGDGVVGAVTVAKSGAEAGTGGRASEEAHAEPDGSLDGLGQGHDGKNGTDHGPEREHGHDHGPDREYGHGPDAKHGHGHREPWVSWLLVLPLLALILVAPPALGSYSAMRTGTALQKPFGYAKLPTGDPVALGLVDYASRAAYDHGHTLGGRRVKVVGFVALDRSGAPYLVRMALNCCAADAQPVKIGLSGRIPPVLRPDTWLEVTGRYSARRTEDPVNGGVIPYLAVDTAKPVPTPHDPYDESWNN
ncbi:TIGR03943 family putative permease subunit [Streptomyces aureus]|uniref:TIGR03943 family putative permease subunit n=1 Tax=Streptomyces aureus TaxID=193461 RepID=UPI003684134C